MSVSLEVQKGLAYSALAVLCWVDLENVLTETLMSIVLASFMSVWYKLGSSKGRGTSTEKCLRKRRSNPKNEPTIPHLEHPILCSKPGNSVTGQHVWGWVCTNSRLLHTTLLALLSSDMSPSTSLTPATTTTQGSIPPLFHLFSACMSVVLTLHAAVCHTLYFFCPSSFTYKYSLHESLVWFKFSGFWSTINIEPLLRLGSYILLLPRVRVMLQLNRASGQVPCKLQTVVAPDSHTPPCSWC